MNEHTTEATGASSLSRPWDRRRPAGHHRFHRLWCRKGMVPDLRTTRPSWRRGWGRMGEGISCSGRIGV
jgi:hypothetical protein